jgi:DNA-binding CsgD family transcriptional regulator/N-acetylneuraminic acid mutarotase
LLNEQAALSEREMEILRLVATGASNQEIARNLTISVNTVKVHLRNIYEKLDVMSRTEATMVAVRQGWVQVPGQEAPAKAEKVVPVAPVLPALPVVERWPQLSAVKRASLAAALVVALASLVFPSIISSKSNGSGNGNSLEQPFIISPSRPFTTRWHPLAQMPTSRAHLAVAAWGDLIYAIGGVGNEGVSGKVEAYDPKADTWTSRSSKPTPVGFVSAGAIEDRIYVAGGVGSGGQIERVLEAYDPVADAWQQRAPLPEGVASYGVAVLDKKLYLFGGWNGREYVATVYRYDPGTDRWETLPPIDQPRAFLGAAVVGDRIYLVGGYDGDTEFGTCDTYDPATGTLTHRSPMAQQRGDLAVIVVREYLYAIGGTMSGYLAFNERYDPRTDTWARIETPVAGIWRGLGLAYSAPYVYAIGGWNGANLSANEAYQPLFVVPVNP